MPLVEARSWVPSGRVVNAKYSKKDGCPASLLIVDCSQQDCLLNSPSVVPMMEAVYPYETEPRDTKTSIHTLYALSFFRPAWPPKSVDEENKPMLTVRWL